MDKTIIRGKKLKELREEYNDCLNLKKEEYLTEYGEGMLCVLEVVFGK